MNKHALCMTVWIGVFCLALTGFGDTLTWVGGNGVNWSTPANWSSTGSHTVPQGGDAVSISGTTVNDLGSSSAPLKLASLTVTGSAAALTGNPIEFPNACTVSSASAFTCGVDIAFTAASGSITFDLHGSNSFQALNAGSRTVSVLLNGGTCTWNGPVTCATYNMTQNWSTPATGTHIFANASNQIAYLDDWRCVVKCGAADCLKGTYVQLGYTFFQNNSDFYLQGFDQTIDRFTAPNPVNNWSILTDQRNGVTAGGRVVAAANEKLTLKATANCYYVGKTEGNLRLVWDPQGNYTMVVSNRTQAMTSPITVKGGTFAAEGGNTVFPNLTGFDVAANAKVRIGTPTTSAFPKLATLNLGAGATFEVTAEADRPFASGKIEATLGLDAKFKLAEGVEPSFKSIKVGDAFVAPGWYAALDSADAASEKVAWVEGAGRVFVASNPGIEVRRFVWTGAGTDDKLTTAANWEGNTAPDLADGSALLVFGAAASSASATLDGPAKVYGLEVNFVDGGRDFAINGTDKLSILAGGIRSAQTINHVLRIYAPVELVCDQAWEPNFTLDIEGPLSETAPGTSLTIAGAATTVINSDHGTFAGPLTITNGYTQLCGKSPLGESDSKVTVSSLLEGSVRKTKPCLTLNNAVVKRPVDLLNGDYMGPFPLQAVDGTTNEITKLFATSANVCRPDIGKSTLIISGGFAPGHLFDPRSDANEGWYVVRDVPFSNVWWYVDGTANLAIETPNCKFNNNVFICPQGNNAKARLETRVENALTADCPLLLGVNAGTADAPRTGNTVEWNLCGCNQQCGNLMGNGTRTTIYSADAATLTVNGGCTNEAVFAGAVSLVKNGTAEVWLKGECTSTGSVTVANGRLRLDSTFVWAQGQRKSAQLGDFYLARGATLQLDAGVRQMVRDLYLENEDGEYVRQRVGTWGAAGNAAAGRTDSRFAGDGVLLVRGVFNGMVLLVK